MLDLNTVHFVKYPNSSCDFNDRQKFPTPLLFDDYHGTRCAGEIVALPNNYCGVGVAYGAKVAGTLSPPSAHQLLTFSLGIRMLSGDVDSATEVEALNYHFQENDIYSCSWGPADDGATVEAPDALIEKALINGVEKGRGGKGSIFVFASGNGGMSYDNCNYDGYANSIYTITVGAVDFNNNAPAYAEHCAAQLFVAYSSGGGAQIVMTMARLKVSPAHFSVDYERRARKMFIVSWGNVCCCSPSIRCICSGSLRKVSESIKL
jgi:kexin